MLVSEILEKYIKEHSVYNLINFSIDSKGEMEKLHPLYIFTQHIIDKFIANGSKRIAIMLPDDDCNILPLIIAKYFSNIQNESDYAGSVLDDIEPGQHIRLGKAVVEFLGIDYENHRIKFRTEKKNPIYVNCPINVVHYLFEKTGGVISSYNAWIQAKQEAEEKLVKTDNFITTLKTKRTALRKTIVVLSPKNDFRESAESLKINGQKFEDVLTYGEINLDAETKFQLYNKGRLDCLPSLTVTSKIEELYYLTRDNNIRDNVFAIFSTIDKFDEVISNPDTLKKILKKEIPLIVFVPESGFESCPLLKEFGFELWHWSPSTMKSEAFLTEGKVNQTTKTKSLFARLAEKINKATLSDFKMETTCDKNLRKSLRLISGLSQQTYNADNAMRQLVRKMWAFQNKLTWLICKIEGRVNEEMSSELTEIRNIWLNQKMLYCGQTIDKSIEEVLDIFDAFIKGSKPSKLIALEKFISSIVGNNKRIKLIVPNKYSYCAATDAYFVSKGCRVQIQTLSEFYSNQRRSNNSDDYLIVTWFAKDEYLRIKQTYCYDHLVFVLYDYENKWRERYITRVDECIPHDSLIKMAHSIGFSQEDLSDQPFDRIFSPENEELEEISDYNISNTIMRSTLENSIVERDGADILDCITVILSEDKIAYFYPTHDIIDVSALSKGDNYTPNKKEAKYLKRGDKILVRQSDRDIIRDMADVLMAQQGETNLRDWAETWFNMLSVYAAGKTIDNVCNALNREGGECSLQQVRYWLSGETIMPRDKSVLIAIGIVSSSHPDLRDFSEKYLNSIDEIFNAGRKVQNYHQKAGFQLTNKLKSMAPDIREISNSSTHRGIVSGIGEIIVYTVEEVIGKEMIGRNHINRIEDLY